MRLTKRLKKYALGTAFAALLIGSVTIVRADNLDINPVEDLPGVGDIVIASIPDEEIPPEIIPEATKETPEERLSLDEILELREKSTTAIKTVDVTTQNNITAVQEDLIKSDMLLAKRLKKLAANSEFNTVIYRGSAFVNVRAEASTTAEKVGKMNYNAVATILDSCYSENGLWYHISSGKVEGYVKSEFFVSGAEAMDLISASASRWVVSKNDSERVYEQDNSNSATIGTLLTDVQYRVEGSSGDFIKIQLGYDYNGQMISGYVPAGSVQLVDNSLQAVTPEDENLLAQTANEASTTIVRLEESRAASRAEEERQASIAASVAEESRRAAERAAAEAAARAEAERQRAEAERQRAEEQRAAEEAAKQGNASRYQDYIPAGTSDLRRAIVLDALRYVGILDYVWGGESLTYGADCSGFCRAIFARHGIDVPHYTVYIMNQGRSVDRANIRPGDLIMYRMTSDSGHVGIYIGNGYIVHSPASGRQVEVTTMDFIEISSIRNVIGD